MPEDDISCNICHTKITVYFHKQYSGIRGKCPTCGVDFPLE